MGQSMKANEKTHKEMEKARKSGRMEANTLDNGWRIKPLERAD